MVNLTSAKGSFTEILLSVLVIAIVFFIPHFLLIPIPFWYAIPVLLICWLFLRRNNENFNTLGFSLKRFQWKAVAAGLIAAALLFFFLEYLFFPFLHKLISFPEANVDDFKFIRHNTVAFIFILLMAWIVGGFYEELVFHGFIFTRIQKMIPTKYALSFSVLLTNIIFGLYHFQQGPAGIINAFIAGLAYQLLALNFKRNLWYAIFFHAFFDTIALTLIYLGH